MAHISLYRKYRSQTFGDLIGQAHVVRTLQNGISTGRVAHAYLFTGPRGTGKTSTARLLAKSLCCELGPKAEPCNECEICKSITAGACVDVIEMDAASESGVDDIRDQIVEVVEYRPMVARYKVFIIDEVHDLSSKAFDALLKTIEEPPAHVIFILATTEYNKVPPTIRSRCQKYEFQRASLSDLVSRLSYVIEHENVEAEPAAVAAIARMADGGYRDALTLLEQAILTSEDNRISLQQVYDQLGLVSEELVDDLLVGIRECDIPRISARLEDAAHRGRDPRAILESLLYRLADLTRSSFQIETSTGDATREASLHETAARLGRDFILGIRGDLAEAHKVIRDISLPRLWLESELMRLAWPRPNSSGGPGPGPAPAPAQTRPAPPVRPAPEAAIPPVSAPLAVEKPVEAAPQPAPVVSSAGSPVESAWQKSMAELTNLSKTLAMKLDGVAAVQDPSGGVRLEFERALDLSWVTERPKAVNTIKETFVRAFGTQCDIEFVVRRKEAAFMGDASPVELPLEGSRLEQLVRDTFETSADSSNEAVKLTEDGDSPITN